MIYLASPYSHPDADVREHRYRQVVWHLANLILEGEIVYCPIAHSHDVAQMITDRIQHQADVFSFEFWRATDEAMMACCSEIRVLCLPGWEKSVGVAAEIEYMLQHNKPVEYVSP